MKRTVTMVLATAGLVLGAASAALAAKDAVTECSRDAVVSGTACVDTFEASVWRIPNPLGRNKGLVTKVKMGTATGADLRAAGATRLGIVSDDYAPCDDRGSGCTNIFALSQRGRRPSSRITWFQAQQACKNSGKRLPSNAEWQAAVAGTPDPGPDNGTTDCNTASTLLVAPTGSRSSCVSADGAFDMVGNLVEWVEDWVPHSATDAGDFICGSWEGSEDFQCLAGARFSNIPGFNTGEPGALLRGGNFEPDVSGGAAAGPLNLSGFATPSNFSVSIGFRCAR